MRSPATALRIRSQASPAMPRADVRWCWHARRPASSAIPVPSRTRFQGDLAPDLTGAGNRWTVSQLRLRMVDASRFNPDTIMPSYYRADGLVRVGRNFTGKPILSAAEIEDIVAYLATLRD